MDGNLSLTLTRSRGERPTLVQWAALSGDPTRVYTLERDVGNTWIAERDAATFTELARIDRAAFGSGFGSRDFIVSGDGALLVAVLQEWDLFVGVYDRSTGRALRIALPERTKHAAIRWATDGDTVVVSTYDGRAHLFDVREGVARGVIEGTWLASSDDGELIALTGRAGFALVRGRDGVEVGRWAVDDRDPWRRCAAISLDPVGLWGVTPVGDASREVDVWWCESGRPAALAGRLEASERIVAARMSGRALALVTARGAVVHARLDSRTGGVTFEAQRGRRGPGVLGVFDVDGLSPDGGRCVGRIGHVAAQVDLATGEVTTWGDGPGSGVAAITASRDGLLLGVAWHGGDVAVLDADTLEAGGPSKWRTAR